MGRAREGSMRLSYSQRVGLELLAERHERAENAGPSMAQVRWAGSREGINGNTVFALVDRGLAEGKWVDTPYRRIVGKITPAGLEHLRSLREKEAVRAERAAAKS